METGKIKKWLQKPITTVIGLIRKNKE